MGQSVDSQSLTPRALQRRLKRRFLKETHRFFAVCTPGFEDVCCSELTDLRIDKLSPETGGVAFEGPVELVYHCNYTSRTATRFLVRIASFGARSYPELYGKVRRIPWELWLGFAPAVSVQVSSSHSRLHHTTNIEKAVADGIGEHMKTLGIGCEQQSDSQFRVFVRFDSDRCTLSMDSSGEVLYRRGYRTDVGRAPVRETTAAALLKLSDWKRFTVIADSMCGSGTFPIEAALMRSGIPAGANRGFAFECWPSYNKGVYERVKERARAEAIDGAGMSEKMLGFDVDPAVIAAAGRNAERAGVTGCVDFNQADCRTFNGNGFWGTSGLVLANAPYGKRLGDREQTRKLLREYGDQLRKTCKGWHFGIILPRGNLIDSTRLRPTWQRGFSNGGLDVVFYFGKVS